MKMSVADPPLSFEGTTGRLRQGLVVVCRGGPMLTRPHVITRPYPQARGAPYNLIRARYFQKPLFSTSVQY